MKFFKEIKWPFFIALAVVLILNIPFFIGFLVGSYGAWGDPAVFGFFLGYLLVDAILAFILALIYFGIKKLVSSS